MTNQQGAPEAPSYEHQRAIMEGERNASLDACSRVVYLTQTESRIYEAGFTNGWNRLAALVEAQQPAAHVQNPVEVEHVAGDVSKNGAESNMAYAELPEQVGWRDSTYHCDLYYDPPYRDGLAPLFTADQMRAFADATHAIRTQRPSPTPQADSQPAPVRDYPPLPMQFACSGVFPVYSADQMRAYVDADRAARAPADSVTAPAGGANWAQLRSALAMLMLGWGRNPNQTMDACYRVLDSATEPGTALAILRTAPDWRSFMAADRAKADSVMEDAARLDWLDQQCEAYGFQDIHEGNRWEISGAYANVRVAIDAERAARKQGGAT